ncbi:hypothetical protein PY364_20645 [Kamptonema sp. UHCC 0994]|nr:hypothetical protein [Kamptonema sp. UHCC 0994]
MARNDKYLTGHRITDGGQLRRNGLILIKGHHAEFAGSRAAVGGAFDFDCQQQILV